MKQISLADYSTRAPKDADKHECKDKLKDILSELDELQNLLYAEHKHSILVILQGMDASGKDGTIRHVLGQMNPQGVNVSSFKVPTEEELNHDFLWRVHKQAPGKGEIKIFNRSHYEDILVTRVHKWCDDETAMRRVKAINDFEQLLMEHNNTQILKFYLNTSAEEQEERLTERIKDPQKQWKYNDRDFSEAKLRKEYVAAYEDCFNYCNRPPWHIVPADQNWYKEYYIADTLCSTLRELKMQYPGIKK